MTTHKGILLEVRDYLSRRTDLMDARAFELEEKLDEFIAAVPDWSAVVEKVASREMSKESKLLALDKWALDSAKLLSDGISKEGE